MNSITPSEPRYDSADPRPAILLVDDDEALRQSLQAVLEAFGFRVVAAENGEAGLSRILAEKPGVIVTDLNMPGLDGFELMNWMRHAGLSVPTIVMSGGVPAHGTLLNCAKTFGAIATFQKPFSPLALIDAITALPAFGAQPAPQTFDAQPA